MNSEYIRKTLRSLGIVLAGVTLTWIHANVIQTMDAQTLTIVGPLYCFVADQIRRALGIGVDPAKPEGRYDQYTGVVVHDTTHTQE